MTRKASSNSSGNLSPRNKETSTTRNSPRTPRPGRRPPSSGSRTIRSPPMSLRISIGRRRKRAMGRNPSQARATKLTRLTSPNLKTPPISPSRRTTRRKLRRSHLVSLQETISREARRLDRSPSPTRTPRTGPSQGSDSLSPSIEVRTTFEL